MEGILFAVLTSSWMGLLKLLFVLAISLGALYFAKRYLDWEEIKAWIPEVAEMMVKVEKLYPNKPGEQKMAEVVSMISQTIPEQTIKKIEKSVFGNVGRFAQYVFTTVAEIVILKKFRK